MKKKMQFADFMGTDLIQKIDTVLACEMGASARKAILMSMYYRLKQKKRDEWPNLNTQRAVHTDLISGLFDWGGSGVKTDRGEFYYWKSINTMFNHLLSQYHYNFDFYCDVTKSIFSNYSEE